MNLKSSVLISPTESILNTQDTHSRSSFESSVLNTVNTKQLNSLSYPEQRGFKQAYIPLKITQADIPLDKDGCQIAAFVILDDEKKEKLSFSYPPCNSPKKDSLKKDKLSSSYEII